MLGCCEKMFLVLYGQTCFLILRPNAGIDARLHLFVPELAASFLAPNRSQILTMVAISAICDLENEPGYMLK